jgi:hypothetical protein
LQTVALRPKLQSLTGDSIFGDFTVFAFNFPGQSITTPDGSLSLIFVAPTTPLPAALPLFVTGIGGLGLLGWRRKRKAVA